MKKSQTTAEAFQEMNSAFRKLAAHIYQITNFKKIIEASIAQMSKWLQPNKSK